MYIGTAWTVSAREWPGEIFYTIILSDRRVVCSSVSIIVNRRTRRAQNKRVVGNEIFYCSALGFTYTQLHARTRYNHEKDTE